MVKLHRMYLLLAVMLSACLAMQSYHPADQIPIRPYWDKVTYTIQEDFIVFYPFPVDERPHSQILLTRNVPSLRSGQKCEKVKLVIEPQFITPFRNGTSDRLLYGTNNGWLRYYMINDFAAFDVDWARICNQTVTRAEVSSSNAYAASCSEDPKLLVFGHLNNQPNNTKFVNFESRVRAYAWRPGTNDTIAIAIQTNGNTPSLFLYDVESQTIIKDLSSFIPGPVIDLSFSSDGKKMALIAPGNAQQEVTIFDLVLEEISYLIADDATNLLEIQTRGRYLTARNKKYAYVWEFDGKNMGKYESQLDSLGLSPYGGQLMTINPQTNNMTLNMLCPGSQTTYNDKKQACDVCDSSCKTCYYSGQQCTSCSESHYWTGTGQWKCKACLTHCLECTSSQSCNKCQLKYYFESADKKCELCADKMSGCLTCSSSQKCSECNREGHWRVDDEGKKCTCVERYYQKGQQCDYCGTGCLKCSSNKQCQICDVDRHWQPSKNKCHCMKGYIQKPNEQVCALCSDYLEGCLMCTSVKACAACMDGYTLSATRTCVAVQPDDNTVTIIVSVIIGVLLIGGIAALVVWYRRKKQQAAPSLLESEAERIQ